MSTSRIFTSGVRAITRRAAQTPTSRQSAMRSVARRGLIGSVVFTIPALAWLYSGSSQKPAAHRSSHGPSHGASSDHGSEPQSESESGAETPDSSSSSNSESESESSDSKSEPETPPPTPSSDSDSKPSSESESKSKPTAANSQLPPPAADNTDMSVDPEGKKASHEDYKQMIRDKDTRKATSSSDVPSKRTAGEHPREDPQQGEGEAVKKGGPE
ncbi:hypothetical protein F5B19DRAFT_492539 [Rostrohypoxylon terebratum]|nr:hypothetical protein F5B19DRAFT_492539 [Rostrohypoxylon terebratum]